MEDVLKTFTENSRRATLVIQKVIPKLAKHDWTSKLRENAVSNSVTGSHYFFHRFLMNLHHQN